MRKDLKHTCVLHLQGSSIELYNLKFLTWESTFGIYLCELHSELLDAWWSYEKQQQRLFTYFLTYLLLIWVSNLALNFI